MNIQELRNLNQEVIESVEGDDKLLMHQLTIKKILQDEKFYFKMEVKYVYALLEDLGIEKDKIKDVYRDLISIENNEEIKSDKF